MPDRPHAHIVTCAHCDMRTACVHAHKHKSVHAACACSVHVTWRVHDNVRMHVHTVHTKEYVAHRRFALVKRMHLALARGRYGPSVYNQKYFSDGDFPRNMPSIWGPRFAYLVDRGYAVCVGEMGGFYTGKDKIWQDWAFAFMKEKVRHEMENSKCSHYPVQRCSCVA